MSKAEHSPNLLRWPSAKFRSRTNSFKKRRNPDSPVVEDLTPGRGFGFLSSKSSNQQKQKSADSHPPGSYKPVQVPPLDTQLRLDSLPPTFHMSSPVDRPRRGAISLESPTPTSTRRPHSSSGVSERSYAASHYPPSEATRSSGDSISTPVESINQDVATPATVFHMPYSQPPQYSAPRSEASDGQESESGERSAQRLNHLLRKQLEDANRKIAVMMEAISRGEEHSRSLQQVEKKLQEVIDDVRAQNVDLLDETHALRQKLAALQRRANANKNANDHVELSTWASPIEVALEREQPHLTGNNDVYNLTSKVSQLSFEVGARDEEIQALSKQLADKSAASYRSRDANPPRKQLSARKSHGGLMTPVSDRSVEDLQDLPSIGNRLDERESDDSEVQDSFSGDFIQPFAPRQQQRSRRAVPRASSRSTLRPLPHKSSQRLRRGAISEQARLYSKPSRELVAARPTLAPSRELKHQPSSMTIQCAIIDDGDRESPRLSHKFSNITTASSSIFGLNETREEMAREFMI